MSQSLVNVGTVANDGTGDPLRNAYIKLNANDSELYSLLDREIKTIIKNAHGFVSGNVLYLDNSGIFQKITTPSTQIPIGIVQTVIDANTFQLVEGGYVTSLSGLTAGTVYYVQTTGLLGTTVTSLKYLVADSTTSGYILSGAGSSMAIGNAVISGTPGSVLFIDSSGFLAQDNGNFYFNNSTHQLSVFTNGDFTGVDAINVYNEVDAFNPNSTQGAIGSGSESGFTFSTARGTGASPTVISSGDLIGGVSGWGYTGSSPAYTSLAGMWATAQGSTSTLGGKLDFRTRADGGALTSRMTIDNTGIMSVISLNAGGMVKSTITTGALSVATPGTDYLAPNGSGASLTDVWLLASGGTLTGPNVVTGTTTNTFKMVFNNLGTTPTNGAGIWLQNQQSAVLNNQQISPSIVLEGQGWGTTPSASQSVQMLMDVLPVQASTPAATWRLRASINGAAYSDILTITNSIANFAIGLNLQQAGVTRIGAATSGGGLTFTQTGVTTSWTPSITSIPGAHTSLTAATEFISRDFQGATQTWLDGTVATQRFNYFRGYTLNKTTTSATFSDIYTLYVDPSTAGTGVTFSRNWALGVNGNSAFGNPTATAFMAWRSTGSGSGVLWRVQNSTPSTLMFLQEDGSISLTQTAQPASFNPAFTSIPGASTNITASTEIFSRDFQGATQTWATGTLAAQRWNYFRGYTAAFVASSTLTNAYTVFIDPPVQGTNATLTNRWSLGLNGALQLFAGTTTMPPLVFQSGTNSSTIINGAVEFDGTHFYGAISGSRVQLDNQVAANGWLANGATTITGNTSQTGAFTETMSFNNVSMNQNVLTGNIIEALIVQTANHTNISTASFDFNSSLSVNPTPKTIQFNASISPLGSVSSTLLRPTGTFSFTSAGTIADVSNVFISSNQSAGTNATFTNSHGLKVTGPAHTGTGTVTNSYGLTVTAGSGAASNFSAQFSGGIGLKFTQASQSGTHNFLDITQAAHTGGNPFGINYVAGAHTGIGTSSPNPDIRFNLTRTVQFTGTATIATTDAFLITQPIYSFASAGGIITNASTLHIQGPPYGGTNTTITNAHGFYVDPLALSNVTNGYGSTINAPSGATNNYAAQFLGGNVGFRTSAPVSYLEIAGSYGDAITTLSANTTLDATHAAVLVDATGAARTITLPAASGATRRIYRIVKKDSSANTVTINTTAGGNKVISTQYAGFCVQSDGTSWFIVGAF